MELLFSNILKGREKYLLKVFYLDTKEEFKITISDKAEKISIGRIFNPMDINSIINKMTKDDTIKEKYILLASNSTLLNYCNIIRDDRIKLFVEVSKSIGKGNMTIKVRNNDFLLVKRINTLQSNYEKNIYDFKELLKNKLIEKYGVPFGVNNVDIIIEVVRNIISNIKANDINECASRLLNLKKPKEFDKTKSLLRAIDRYRKNNF